MLDDAILGGAYNRPNRAAFLAGSLADLAASLHDRGAGLVIRRGDPVEEVVRLAAQVHAARVHLSGDVSRYAQRRQRRLARRLHADRRELVVHDAVITAVAPGAVTPARNDHFAVFTPYHRAWSRVHRRSPLTGPRQLSMPAGIRRGDLPGTAAICPGETGPGLAAGGESEGRRRAGAFLRAPVDRYADLHDDLVADATSRLSPYIHFGCVSVTELVHRCGTQTEGRAAFVRQLARRDFHHQVLAARPDAATADYRGHDDHWRDEPDEAAAWRAGRTGYPIIDAGMRQLAAEGWMHNRARLLVGSFLAKTLYLDWRIGARHFTDLLLDADIANNQLNWQWVAGTGTDTRPGRVLNPLAQTGRHDPDGVYVRRYVPELAGVDGKAVHEPWRLDADVRRKLDYPEPIADLKEGLARLRSARS